MPDELATTAPPEAQAAPPAQAPPPADAPEQSAFVKQLAELGFEGVGSEDEARERLVSAYRQQREQVEQIRTEFKTALEAVRGSQAQVDSPPSSAGNQSWFNPPTADLELASRFRNADGTWKEGTPGEVRQSVEAREAYLDRFARKLVSDPEGTLAPLLEQKFEQFFNAKYGQLTAEQQERQTLGKALSENEPWLFEKDPLTGSVNRQKLTLEGQRFNELFIEFEREGLPQSKAFNTALRIFKAEKATSASKQLSPEEAAQINAEKKQGLLNTAAPGASRGASLPDKTKVRNNNLSTGQRFVQNAQREGVGV